MKKKIGSFFAVWSILAAAAFSISLYLGMMSAFWISLAVLILGIVIEIICFGKACKKVLWNVIDVMLSL